MSQQYGYHPLNAELMTLVASTAYNYAGIGSKFTGDADENAATSVHQKGGEPDFGEYHILP
jgi:hypothetical protein